jgi:flagellar biosynthesis/type III secretory pathway protein FliH
MTFLVLHADTMATALADDPVVPAASVPHLTDALALLNEAARMRNDTSAAIEAAIAQGHAEGLEAGRSEGRASAETEGRAELFRLAIRDGEERRARQVQLGRLALEIVRRIAGEIGSEAMIAGIAERAAAQLAPDTAAVVRVPPSAVAAVRQRLAGRASIAVEADVNLAADDCVVETAIGRTHAGLDTQLQQIERAWAEAGRNG